MVRRNSSRLGGNRPRTHPSLRRKNRSIETQKAREKAQALNFILLRLGRVRSVVVTAAAALSHQNADRDADIGSCLFFAAADPLTTAIEQLEKLTGQGESHE